MNYVWVDKNSIDNFLGVLPEDFIENSGNICICACGDNGDAWGAICYSLVDNQIDILWLYTAREKRRQGIATALLDKLFEISSLSGEIYPVSARFEPYSDEGVYGFFLSYDRMDTVFSHERFYVSPGELRGAKLPPASGKDEFEKIRKEQGGEGLKGLKGIWWASQWGRYSLSHKTVTSPHSFPLTFDSQVRILMV